MCIPIGIVSLGATIICFYFTLTWVTGSNIGGFLPIALFNPLYTATHLQRFYTTLTFLSASAFFASISAALFGWLPDINPDPYIFILLGIFIVLAIFGGAFRLVIKI